MVYFEYCRKKASEYIRTDWCKVANKSIKTNKLIGKLSTPLFYCYINALHFINKNIYYTFWNNRSLYYYFVCIIQLIYRWIRSAFSCVKHRADQAPATITTPNLNCSPLQTDYKEAEWAVIGACHTYPCVHRLYRTLVSYLTRLFSSLN